MNEYANSEAVTYAVRQAENESAKRRKMQAVNPYDGEEVDDSKDKMKMFRMRKSEDRPMYEYSTWGRMLRNPRTRDGLDARWEKDINYAGIDGEHAAEDMFIFRQHLSRVKILSPIADYSFIGVDRFRDRFEILHGEEVEEYETSYKRPEG